MDVILGDIGQLEIHHLRQLVNIQSAGGDIGRHQDRHRTLFEACQRARARRLALIAVDRHGCDSIAL